MTGLIRDSSRHGAGRPLDFTPAFSTAVVCLFLAEAPRSCTLVHEPTEPGQAAVASLRGRGLFIWALPSAGCR